MVGKESEMKKTCLMRGRTRIALIFVLSIALVFGMMPVMPGNSSSEVYAAEPDIVVNYGIGGSGTYSYNVSHEFGFDPATSTGALLRYSSVNSASSFRPYTDIHGVEIKKIIDEAVGMPGYFDSLGSLTEITFTDVTGNYNTKLTVGGIKEVRYQYDNMASGTWTSTVPALLAYGQYTDYNNATQSNTPRLFIGQKSSTDVNNGLFNNSIASISIGINTAPPTPAIGIFSGTTKIGQYSYNVTHEYGYNSGLGAGKLLTFSSVNSSGSFRPYTNIHGVEIKKIIDEAVGAGYFDSLGSLTEITLTDNTGSYNTTLTVGAIQEQRYRYDSSASAIWTSTVPAVLAYGQYIDYNNALQSNTPRFFIGQRTSTDVNNGLFNNSIASISIGANTSPPIPPIPSGPAVTAPAITVSSASISGIYNYSIADEYASGASLTYSMVNDFGTFSTYSAVHGVTVKDVINKAFNNTSYFDLLDPTQGITFEAADGFKTTITVAQLRDPARYSFAVGQTTVPALIAYGTYADNSKTPSLQTDTPRNFIGQKSATEKTSGFSVKKLTRITIGAKVEKLPNPTADPTPGTVLYGTLVRLNCGSKDADIYYTLDGTEPSINSKMYNTIKDKYLTDNNMYENPPIVVTGKGTFTIKAKAMSLGYLDSDTITFTYTVTGDDKLAELKADSVSALYDKWYDPKTKAKYSDALYLNILIELNKAVKKIQNAPDATKVAEAKKGFDSKVKVLVFKDKRPVIKSLTAGKKKTTVKWKKVSGVAGYKIVYSTSKSFKSKKVVTVKSKSAVKKVVAKLKAGKNYFFKIRGYTKIDGKTYYTKYSKVKKSKKVKK